MLSTYYVYEHRRKDNGAVFYVGKGKGSRSSNGHNRGRYWNNVCNKAGGYTITYPVKDVDEELALLAEVELIDLYRRTGVRIVNINDGGEGAPGWVPSEETRRKIGEANRHTPKASGERHGMYGKKHSEESLAKMRESQQKVARKGEAHHMYGKHHTEEALAKMSEAIKGKFVGEQNPFYGKKHSEETRRLISEKSTGRKTSDETKAKQRAAMLASAVGGKLSRPVFCVTNGKTYHCINAAQRELSVARQLIRMVCNGKMKQTKGYVFEWSK